MITSDRRHFLIGWNPCTSDRDSKSMVLSAKVAPLQYRREEWR